jgi:hypothetical protein
VCTGGARDHEQPTKFDLAVNLNTAKALSVALSELFRQRADKVIE